jgi:hypothetical protein
VQNSSHAVILLFLLRRSLPGLRLGSALLPFLARVVPAAALVGIILVATVPFLSLFGGLMALIASGCLATVIYVALLQALGVPEIRTAFSLVRARLFT